jgi:hypothetical protein
MGKRELGLILGFIVIGLVVWQVTAPEAEGPGFSVSGWLSEVRQEMRPRNASAEVVTTPAIPIDASTSELRLTLSAGGEVVVRGEDRADIGATLTVASDGVDEAEAKELAGKVALKVSRFADSVVVGWDFPEPGRQIPSLTLLVPTRLRIQLEGRGDAEVGGVDAVTLARQTGELTLKDIRTIIQGESRGTVKVDGARAVDLSIANNETTLKGVTGDVKLNVRSGEVVMEKSAGRVEITGTDVRVRMEGVGGDLRIEVVEGEIELSDVSAPIDLDLREAPATVDWTRAAVAKIEVRDGGLDLTLPRDAAAFSLDARTAGGELKAPDHLQKTTDGSETSVTKTAGPGAPAIFVRGVDATITIR